MFRAMSTRKIHGGYKKLGEEEPSLKRVSSVPGSVYGNSRNLVQEVKKTPMVKPSGGSVHPLLSFFDVRFQKKKKKAKVVVVKSDIGRRRSQFAVMYVGD